MSRRVKILDTKNLLIILLSLFVVVGTEAYEYIRHAEEKSEKEVPISRADSAPILYTADGFTPERIEVRVNTAVSWKNSNNRPMWVASNPHPAHTDLSAFDQKKIGQIGSEYRYVFTRPGIFKYHNHIVPSDRGEIIVKE